VSQAPFAAIRRTGEPPPRVAVIDLGSNTALMTVLVADERDRRRLHVAEELHVITGLGRDRQPDGKLGLKGRGKALAVMRHFGGRLDALGVGPDAVAGAATAAVREASDGVEFLEEVRRRSGVPLRVIDGDQEAELVALAQERSFPDRMPLQVVDLGGCSTEVALRERGQTAWKVSIPTGSVRLSETCGADVAALRAAVDEAVLALPAHRGPATMVGVAGTVTTAFQVAHGIDPWDPDLVHGHELELARIEALLPKLAAMGPDERRAVPGLDPGRADYIVAGMCMLSGLMRRFGCEALTVSDRGVRFGLLYETWPLAAVL
jgi:exopolyphosphatase / guanosine-5'-triphosphate,3'-diphosphate pyrophosphatase